MARPKGFILQRGVSPIDGQSFVAILTRVWQPEDREHVPGLILRSESPVDAIKSGADVSVCGNCLHRRQADFDPAPVTSTWDRLRCLSGVPTKQAGIRRISRSPMRST